MRTLGDAYIKYVPQTIYAQGSGTALTIYGSTANSDSGIVMYTGDVTAVNQTLNSVRLRVALGQAYAGNGTALNLDSMTNNSDGTSDSRNVASVYSYLIDSGSGGTANDHSGALIFGTKAPGDAAPVGRMIIGAISGGVVIGPAAGGDQGIGTLNCTGLFVNGVPVTVP